MFDTSKIKGEVELIVEDKNGNTLDRVSCPNTITDAFKKYALYDMMVNGGLGSFLASQLTNQTLVARAAISYYGIYCLSDKPTITATTQSPPYVDKSGVRLSNNVVFYGDPTYSSTESNQVMTRKDTFCYYNVDETSFQVEFRKETGSGTINSVAIGALHSNRNQLTYTNISDPRIDSLLRSAINSTSYYGFFVVEEETSDDTVSTILYKNNATTSNNGSKVVKINLKTGKVEDIPSNSGNLSNMNYSMGNMIGGAIKVGSSLYGTRSNSSGVVKISYIENWTTGYTVQDISVNVDLSDEEITTKTSGRYPCLVYNSTTKKVEVFICTGYNSSKSKGCYNHKIIIDPANSNSHEVVSLGWSEYGIGCIGNSQAYTSSIGLYDSTTQKYYLPTYQYIDNGVTQNLYNSSSGDFTEGQIFDSSMNPTERIFFNSGSYLSAIYANTRIGIHPVITNHQLIPYRFGSQLVSLVNLSKPVTKNENDILRVIYKYSLS